ncbi:tRNA (adenosine(37)-N6)-threonylcarbamoyltransferase complex transferase subunit TsaD [Candidatus Soleaferrea massiliensis]|uniref:tRNA (adenosine(37)-N6)-threonylcarbamoyltransferase complex transferase subunit TsaD n=1 Tax=Candidatus Soleaferrea massiliensis TaxID=1470354 RepID=UPI00058EC0CA|nr:tRNA (adenosine(37)-N6)-threonylcarbamoyltransferase complex transferase subunit TsaD [Candidatus Soleaferrea massiliensis]
MRILGIESSCDETACAVVEDGRKILSNVVNSQIEEHKIYGGVVPEIASRMHTEAIGAVCREALDKAGLTLDDIDALAVTYAPGLIGALLVGVNFAKSLGFAANKPLIPVHHIRGHIAANYLSFPQLAPPFICLVVSGGHTNIVEVLSYTDFKILARTRDDAAGEAFDKVARSLGFPYPGGIYIDKAAKLGREDAFRLPHPKVEGSPYDFSFSGLKTFVLNTVNHAKQKGQELNANDLAASFQKTVCDMLVSRLMQLTAQKGYRDVVVAGGVSANSGLREKLQSETKRLSLNLYIPPLSLCGDNAAMIASQGYYEYLAGNLADLSLNGCSSLPIEQSYICAQC